jgi:hypothetical protein
MPKARRSEKEIATLVAGYERSGLTRRQYCERTGLALTTLDYYRQKRSKRKSPGMVAVRLTPGEARPAPGIALVLRNGRRIEISGEIVEAELAKLVRVAEQA